MDLTSEIEAVNAFWGDNTQSVDESIQEDITTATTPLESETDTSEEVVDNNIESEVIEEDYPSFIPDEYKPKTFKDEKEEVEFYRQNYRKALNHYKSEEFSKTLKEQYKDSLLKEEEDYETLKKIHTSFKDDPELMFKLYYPENLAKRGIDVQFSPEEQNKVINRVLSDSFGSNYKDKYDPNEALDDPSSMSAKMLDKQREVKQALQEAQTKAEASIPDPKALEKTIVEQRQKYFKNIPEDEFNSFIKEVETWQPTLLDIHRAKNFDTYAEQAYQLGLVKGREANAQEFKKAGKTIKPSSPEVKPEEKRMDNYFHAFSNSNNGLPDFNY